MEASQQEKKMVTIDAFLSQFAKTLKPGESISIPLYKGASRTTNMDPNQAHKATKAAATIGAKAPAQSVLKRNEITFPRILKFIETVDKPNFQKPGEFADGRLYMEDIPKAKEDSDDEESEMNPQTTSRKRWRKNEPPKQCWVLQTNQEFVQKIKTKALKSKNPAAAAKLEQELSEQLSNRYHGLPEANSSSYVTFEAKDPSLNNGKPSIQVTAMHGFTNFTQPAKFKTLSLQDAEEALTSKKNMTRYMMHSNANDGMSGLGDGVKKGRSRLLGKLTQEVIDEEDDVMGDIRFKEQTSSRSAANELLNDLGDGDVKIDAEGILGGANDLEFGGKRRFMRVAGNKKEDEGNATSGKKQKKLDGGNTGAAGTVSEASAMQQNFYQRDVGAEYEELDYDPNEQFDDDDVDIGAEEVTFDEAGGFAADIDSDSGDDDDDDDEVDLSGFEDGFATSAGMKAMIAKAKGEEIQPPIVAPIKTLEKKTNMSDASGSDRSDEEQAADSPSSKPTTVNTNSSAAKSAASNNQLDENGHRIITKDNVRREIWLNGGNIKLRALAKTYKISGRAAKERKDLFKKICLELCTSKDGVLYLKQHYSKMAN